MRHPTRCVATVLALCVVPAMFGAATAGCAKEEEAYKPHPAFSGRAASLPAVPTLSNKPVKVGDAFTVFGAIHHLRSRVHQPDVAGKEITLVGYIVKTNLAEAPICAVHKTGKGDPDDCKSAIPAFWIADEKGDVKNAIKVMGWASNYAQIFDAIPKYANKANKDPVKDEMWGQEIPNPIPNIDAKVQVTGTYGTSFTKATSGVETDPLHGLLTFSKMTYVEPPTEPGTLPGLKVR